MIQYYSITSTGAKYAQDLSTGQVQQVASIPAGAPVMEWGGAGLPFALQNAGIGQPSVTPQVPIYNAYPTSQPTQQPTQSIAQAYQNPPTQNVGQQNDQQPQVPGHGMLPSSLISTITQNLGPGSQGSQVQSLQQALVQAGYLTPEQYQTGPGIYGPATTAAVAAWQSANGVNNGGNAGYFGPQSKAFLAGAPQNSQPIEGGTPHFLGDDAIIQIQGASGSPAYFLAQKNEGTVRPISSIGALQNIFGNNFSEAMQQAVTITSPTVAPTGEISSGALQGFHMLDSSYTVQNDGTAKGMAATPTELANQYGQAPNPNLLNNVGDQLNSFMNLMEQSPTAFGLDTDIMKSLNTDQPLMAAYANAMTYGGYSLGDVYSDLKRQTLIKQGDTSMDNIQLISPTLTRPQYLQTSAGQQAYASTQLKAPYTVSSAIAAANNKGGLAIYSTPDSLYQTPADFVGTGGSTQALPPIEEMTSDQISQQMGKLSQATAAYYDVLNQQLSATTDQQAAVAAYNWQNFKDYTEKNLGLSLSNDAITAWGQLQALGSQYGALNLGGSGLQQESIDDYLKKVRNSDAVTRSQVQTNELNAQQTYYTQYATADQVKQFAEQNPKLAQSWGLVPSDDVKSSLTPDALMAKYPGLTEDQANYYISSVLDQNGNYRSALYGTYMDNQRKNLGQEYKTLGTAQTTASQNSINQSMATYTKDPFMSSPTGQNTTPTVNGINQTSTTVPATPSTVQSFAGSGASSVIPMGNGTSSGFLATPVQSQNVPNTQNTPSYKTPPSPATSTNQSSSQNYNTPITPPTSQNTPITSTPNYTPSSVPQNTPLQKTAPQISQTNTNTYGSMLKSSNPASFSSLPSMASSITTPPASSKSTIGGTLSNMGTAAKNVGSGVLGSLSSIGNSIKSFF